jgi:L-arabinokinase
MTVVYYISGHGFGHASRSVEVIRELQQLDPRIRIAVRTMAPAWFLDRSLGSAIERQPVDTDTGVVQIDSLRLDEDQTARVAASFYASFDRRVAEEAAALRELAATVVAGDIPPLAFAAAHRAGIPSVAVANFTWDWIYAGYPHFEPLAPGTVELIARAYSHASLALRLPFSGGFDSMKAVTRDVPLIARKATHTRDAARRRLGIDDGPVVLASFGGHGLRLPYETIARRNSFTLIVTDVGRLKPAPTYEGQSAGRLRPGPTYEGQSAGRLKPGPAYEGQRRGRLQPAHRLLRITLQQLTDLGIKYEDLVAASDVVVTKAGYGIVSECIANDAAMLYTPRGRFREHDVFLAEMPKYLRCREITNDDLRSGNWQPSVEAVLSLPGAPQTLRTDGAAVCAEAICGILANR